MVSGGVCGGLNFFKNCHRKRHIFLGKVKIFEDKVVCEKGCCKVDFESDSYTSSSLSLDTKNCASQ